MLAQSAPAKAATDQDANIYATVSKKSVRGGIQKERKEMNMADNNFNERMAMNKYKVESRACHFVEQSRKERCVRPLKPNV